MDAARPLMYIRLREPKFGFLIESSLIWHFMQMCPPPDTITTSKSISPYRCRTPLPDDTQQHCCVPCYPSTCILVVKLLSRPCSVIMIKATRLVHLEAKVFQWVSSAGWSRRFSLETPPPWQATIYMSNLMQQRCQKLTKKWCTFHIFKVKTIGFAEKRRISGIMVKKRGGGKWADFFGCEASPLFSSKDGRSHCCCFHKEIPPFQDHPVQGLKVSLLHISCVTWSCNSKKNDDRYEYFSRRLHFLNITVFLDVKHSSFTKNRLLHSISF